MIFKVLVDYFSGQGTNSFMACTALYFLYQAFVGAELFLLDLMAYHHTFLEPQVDKNSCPWMISLPNVASSLNSSRPFSTVMYGDNRTNSTDFFLMGFFSHNVASGLIFIIVFIIFFIALMANGAMIFLINTDTRLHTPMYFLLSHLSFIDIIYITTIVPKMLVDYFSGQGTISFMACTAQYFLYQTFVGAEFFLLGLMAYDRYVAICYPLRYPVLMSRQICVVILVSSWFGGSLDSFLLTPITMSLPFCASHQINHFFCEAPTMLRLACGDKAVYEMVMYVCCVMMLLIPFSIIITSYTKILITVHHMNSAEGRKKALTTCSSHIIVVTLFYGAALYTYMLPQSYHTPVKDKIFSAFYTILTPMFNPLIYSLRNKDVTGAMKRALGRCKRIPRVTGDEF